MEPEKEYLKIAQWIDSGEGLSDVNKLYKSIYKLCMMLSCKRKAFSCTQDYEDFCNYFASKLVLRLQNEKTEPIKSILCYMKHVFPLWRADFMKECGKVLDDYVELSSFNFSDYLVDVDSLKNDDYISTEKDILNIIKKHLSSIPTLRNSPEKTNIYISCFLTLNERIQAVLDILCKHRIQQTSVAFDAIIRTLKTRPPVLFHVDEKRASYISVLVNEVIHRMSKDITQASHTTVSVETCLQNLVIAYRSFDDGE